MRRREREAKGIKTKQKSDKRQVLKIHATNIEYLKLVSIEGPGSVGDLFDRLVEPWRRRLLVVLIEDFDRYIILTWSLVISSVDNSSSAS